MRSEKLQSPGPIENNSHRKRRPFGIHDVHEKTAIGRDVVIPARLESGQRKQRNGYTHLQAGTSRFQRDRHQRGTGRDVEQFRAVWPPAWQDSAFRRDLLSDARRGND